MSVWVEFTSKLCKSVERYIFVSGKCKNTEAVNSKIITYRLQQMINYNYEIKKTAIDDIFIGITVSHSRQIQKGRK